MKSLLRIMSFVLVLMFLNPLYAQDKPKEKKKALPLEPGRNISFTTDAGTWMSLDVSPDGSQIVFEHLGDLFTLPISGGKATRISSGMAMDMSPRFSPDGSQIVFLSDRSGSENLYLLDINKTIVDTTKASNETGLTQLTKGKKGDYASPDWTPDGEYIITSKAEGFSLYNLRMYHVDGGSGIKLMGKEKNRNALGAAYGADSRYIYFSTKTGGFGYDLQRLNWQIASYDTETGEFYRITNESGGAVRPVLSPDGKFLVYATRHDAQTGFKLRELASGNEKWLAYPVQRDDQESAFTRDLLPAYSFMPDSKAIISVIDGKITSVDIASGEKTVIPFEVDVELQLGPLVEFDNRVDDGPVNVRQIRWPTISPDGKTLLFTAMHKVYTKELTSGNIKELVDIDAGQFDPAWNSDGKKIAFVTWSDSEGGAVYVINTNGKNLKKISNTNAYFSETVWRPDDSEVIVARGPWQQRREDSIFNFIPGQGQDLVRLPIEGGEAVKIAPFKGVSPHFADSPDRLYVYEGNTGLVSMRLDGTDRKVHVKVTGYTRNRAGAKPSPAAELLMGPDGKSVLALSQNHVYKVIVPKLVGETPTISLMNPKAANFPVTRLTSIGAGYMNWHSSGEALWSMGATLFRYNFAIAKAFEEAQAEVSTTDEKSKKDVVKYEPVRVSVELEMPRAKGDGTIVFRGGKILSMASGASNDGIIENGVIVVVDSRITMVGLSSEIQTPSGAREIDITGKTVLPGFVDTHSHMWPAWGVHHETVWEYLANLSFGVITGRDPQTSTTDILTYADMVDVGAMPGPRVFQTGPGIFESDIITSLEDARNVMKRYSEFYKLNTIKQYVAGDRDVRQWLIQAAREQGIMPTTEGGLDMKLDFTQIVDGYPGHEHSFPVSPLYDDFVKFIAKSGVYYTPTLVVAYGGPAAENYYYRRTNVHDNERVRKFVPHTEVDKLVKRGPWFADDEHVFPLHAKQAKKILDEGGKVAIGGHGQFQGLAWHWELWSVQSGGMTEMEALRCGTLFGAEAIGYDADLGSLEAGKLADILILDDDPLKDIRNSTSISMVMKNGLLYNAETLDMIWPREEKLPTPYWWNNDPKDQIKK